MTQLLHVSAYMKPSSGCNLKGTLIYNWQRLKIVRSRLHFLIDIMYLNIEYKI